jgi:flagellar motor switch protein FliN
MSSSPTLSFSTERPVQALEAHDALAPLYDIRCHVDVVIGTGSLSVRECLTLQREQIVRMVEPAGGDLSIRVHGVSLATGEIVVVDDIASLRVTRVLPPVGLEG